MKLDIHSASHPSTLSLAAPRIHNLDAVDGRPFQGMGNFAIVRVAMIINQRMATIIAQIPALTASGNSGQAKACRRARTTARSVDWGSV